MSFPLVLSLVSELRASASPHTRIHIQTHYLKPRTWTKFKEHLIIIKTFNRKLTICTQWRMGGYRKGRKIPAQAHTCDTLHILLMFDINDYYNILLARVFQLLKCIVHFNCRFSTAKLMCIGTENWNQVSKCKWFAPISGQTEP